MSGSDNKDVSNIDHYYNSVELVYNHFYLKIKLNTMNAKYQPCILSPNKQDLPV